MKPLHKIAPRSSHVNPPGRDLNPANICTVCRVNLPGFAKILDFGLFLRDFARAAAWSSSQAQRRNPPPDRRDISNDDRRTGGVPRAGTAQR